MYTLYVWMDIHVCVYVCMYPYNLYSFFLHYMLHTCTVKKNSKKEHTVYMVILAVIKCGGFVCPKPGNNSEI